MPNTTNGVPYVSSSDYVSNYPTVSQTLANVVDPIVVGATRVCTSTTRPSSPVEGYTIYETDTDTFYTYNGSAWVQTVGITGWTDFTPTFSNSWANGNATVSGKYARIGRLITFTAEITIGSSTTKGASTMRLNLPVAARAQWDSGLPAPNIHINFLDVGTAGYWGAAFMQSTSTFDVWVQSANTTFVAAVAVNATFPMTWATGDKIIYSGTYEAAS